MNRNIIVTIVVVVLLVAVAAGVGLTAFRAGQAYGISQAPAVATALAERPDSAVASAPFVMGPGFYGFGRPGFGPFGGHFGWGGGFGIFQCLVPLFFLLLLFALFRLIFRPWGWGWRGGWRRDWHHGGPNGEGLPPMFEEWHRRAHGQTPPPPPTDTPPSTNA